jgi:hypothetical protein
MWVNTIFEAEYVRQLSLPVRYVYCNGAHPECCGRCAPARFDVKDLPSHPATVGATDVILRRAV